MEWNGAPVSRVISHQLPTYFWQFFSGVVTKTPFVTIGSGPAHLGGRPATPPKFNSEFTPEESDGWKTTYGMVKFSGSIFSGVADWECYLKGSLVLVSSKKRRTNWKILPFCQSCSPRRAGKKNACCERNMILPSTPEKKWDYWGLYLIESL